MKTHFIACLLCFGLLSVLNGQIIFNSDPNALPGMTPTGGVPKLKSQPQQQLTPEERIIQLKQTGTQLFMAGQMQEALNAYAEVYQQVEKIHGAGSRELAAAGLDVSTVFRQGANYPEAVKWAERAIVILQKLGEQKKKSLEYGLALQRLAETYMDVSEIEGAHKAAKEVHEILSGHLPEKDLRRVMALHDLGVSEQQMGMKEATGHLRKALELREELTGTDSIPVAYTAMALAKALMNNMKFKEAEPLMLRGLAIMKAHVNQEAGMTLRAMGDMLQLYSRQGKLNQQESLLAEKMELLRKTVGEEHELGDSVFEQQSLIHSARGQFLEAEKCLLTALERIKKHRGEGSLPYGGACADLGNFYFQNGAEARAEFYYQIAYRNMDEAAGQENDAVAKALIQAGRFYLHKNHPDNLLAYDCLTRGLAGMSKLGSSFDVTVTLDWALAAHRNGRDENAKKYLLDVMKEMEKNNNANSRYYSDFQSMLFQCTGSHSYQEDAIKRCAKLLNETLAKKPAEDEDNGVSSGTIDSMSVLSQMNLDVGRFADAEKWAGRALDCWHQYHPDTLRKSETMQWLISAIQAQNKTTEARNLIPEWLENSDANLETLIATQGGKLGAGLQQVRRYVLPASLGLAKETAMLLLHDKAIGLELQMLDHREKELGSTPEGKPLWEKLANLRSEFRETLDLSPDVTTVRELRGKIEETETNLMQLAHSDNTVWKSLRLTSAQVDAALPADAALVDYFDYPHRLPSGALENSYGIVVLRHGQEPKLYRCPENSDKVDEMAGYFTIAMESPGKQPRDKDKALSLLCHKGYETLIRPIEKELEGVKTLFICPDHRFQFMPFSVLLDSDEHFLVERFSVRYLNSARDLLNTGPEAQEQHEKTVAIFGDAAYHQRLTVMSAFHPSTLEGALCNEFLEARKLIKTGPLPGATRELELVKSQAESHAWKPLVFRDTEASEAGLRSLQGTDILHLATHAFFIPNPRLAARERELALERKDPRMPAPKPPCDSGFQRTGLLFSKAEDSMDFWTRDYLLPKEDDGFLSAEEISDLDLHSNRLVFLSACDPGETESSNAGLPALRAALLHAGARNIILTLWPAKDAEAAAFVGQFYGRYFDTDKVADSLEQTQRECLVRVSEKDGLWEAIKQAGAYMLTSGSR